MRRTVFVNIPFHIIRSAGFQPARSVAASRSVSGDEIASCLAMTGLWNEIASLRCNDGVL
jgi:hypothetical protein